FQSHAVRWPCFWSWRIRSDRSSRVRKLCGRNHDLLWRIQTWMENGRLSQFSNCDGAGPLVSSDLDGLYAASLSQDVHGHDGRTVERSCGSSPCVACAGDDAAGSV